MSDYEPGLDLSDGSNDPAFDQTAVDVLNMTMEEYAQHREDLLKWTAKAQMAR